MRTLKVNEAVHCRTQEEFDTINEILCINNKTLSSNDWLRGKENTCIGAHSLYGYGYEDKQWFIDHECKIFTYNEFMGINKWKPVIGEKYWILLFWDITCINKRIWDNNKTDNSFYKIGNCFKTRKLARTARANLLKCINEQEHE